MIAARAQSMAVARSSSVRAMALVFLAAVTAACSPDRIEVSDETVQAVHAQARPLDAHSDILVSTTPEIYRTDDGVSQLTVDKLTGGGMAVQVLALQAATGPDTETGRVAARSEITAKLATVLAMIDAFPEQLGRARSVADIEALNAEGRVAIVFGFQNAYVLGSDLSLLESYIAAGVRIFGFNHAGNNAFSDSSRPSVPNDEWHGGLSELGVAAVERLNDAGVVIDVSQLTPNALMQVIAASRAPVIASHSAVRAMIDETRNLLDSELDAIAAAGGAACIPPFNTYLAPRPAEFRQRLEEIRSEYGLPATFRGVLDDSNLLEGAAGGEYMGRALAAVPRATLEDYVDHIDYVVQRVGVDHVCIGTDFDHGAGIIGYAHAGDAANLTRALLERGYSADDVSAIWSGNVLRVMRAAEAVAR